MSDNVFVGQNGQKYKAVEHERKFLKFGADGEPVYRYPTTIYCEPFGPRRCTTCGSARAKVGRQCRQCAHPEPALERYKQEATHRDARRRNSKRRALKAKQAREAYRAALEKVV